MKQINAESTYKANKTPFRSTNLSLGHKNMPNSSLLTVVLKLLDDVKEAKLTLYVTLTKGSLKIYELASTPLYLPI
jgi:hypothetical protein